MAPVNLVVRALIPTFLLCVLCDRGPPTVSEHQQCIGSILVLSHGLMAPVKNVAMYRTDVEPIDGAHDIKKRQPNLRCSVTNRPTAPGAGAQWPPPLLSLRDDSAAGERMVDGSGFYPSHLVVQRTSDAMYRPRSIKDRTGIEPHAADALRASPTHHGGVLP